VPAHHRRQAVSHPPHVSAQNLAGDATLWGAAVYGFNNQSDLAANVAGVGIFTAVADNNLACAECGARVGYALTDAMTFDVFAEGVSGESESALNRFAVSSWMLFKVNTDASLDLYFQNESPATDKETNWLPAPKGPFNLT
jgi:hypothetical protein